MTQQKFSEHQLVPDMLDHAPDAKIEVTTGILFNFFSIRVFALQVHYGSNELNLGNVVTPAQAKSVPTQIGWPTESGVLYTLIMSGTRSLLTSLVLSTMIS